MINEIFFMYFDRDLAKDKIEKKTSPLFQGGGGGVLGQMNSLFSNS